MFAGKGIQHMLVSMLMLLLSYENKSAIADIIKNVANLILKAAHDMISNL